MTTATMQPSRRRVQRRTLTFISLAQIVSGIGTGTVVSTGSLIAVDLSGSEAWAGSVTTTMTLGAAIASALLMRLALARGRRISLAVGLAVAAVGAVGIILAALIGAFWLLIIAGALIGFGTSVNLQARFAATDLSSAEHRGRDLSLIVWMSTIGAVAGPNLVGVGELIAPSLGLPLLAGVFVLTTIGMLLGMLIIWIGVRPDPYLLLTGRIDERGRRIDATEGAIAPTPGHRGLVEGLRALWATPDGRVGLVSLAVAHGVMVGVMSVTPVHLAMHDASIVIVGVTVSLHIAGMYALSPVMGALSDRIGGRWVAASGLGIIVLAAVLAGVSGDAHWLTMTGLILLGLGWSAASVAGSAMIAGATPLEERVASQGVADMSMSLAGAVGGLLAGVALGTIGYLGLGLCAAALTVVVLVLAFARRGAAVGAAS